MPISFWVYYKRYIFNLANLFLIFLILIISLKLFFDFEINKKLQNTEKTVEIIALILKENKNYFNQFEYTIYANNSWWLGTLSNSKNYLETGKFYKIYAEVSYLQINQDNNYHLSYGYNGTLKIKEILATDINCNWLCNFLKWRIKLISNLENNLFNNLCKQNWWQFNFNIKCQDLAIFSTSLVIGQNANFSKDFFISFKNLGLSHIIAVSGFQVVIFMSVIEYIFNKIISNRKIVFLGSIFGILLLLFLTGVQIPVFRSAISIFLILSSLIFFGRKLSTFRATIYSGLILLTLNSFYILNFSFLLSILASFGLSLIPNINFYNKKYLNVLFSLFLTPLYAFLTTLPIIIYLSNGIYPIGVLVNVIITPLIPILYFLALFSITPLIGELTAIILKIVLYIFMEIINFFTNFNFKINFYKTNITDILIYLCLLFFILITIMIYSKYQNINYKNFIFKKQKSKKQLIYNIQNKN